MQITVNDAVRAELDALHKKHGRLTEDLVVAASKPKGSALHKMFLWDDPAAAAAIGREVIARQLIIRVKVTTVEAEEMNVTVGVRRYHGRMGGGYHDIGEIVTRDSMRQMLLANAKADFLGAKRRYEELAELVGIFAAIDATFPEGKKKKRPRKRKPK